MLRGESAAMRIITKGERNPLIFGFCVFLLKLGQCSRFFRGSN